jgi:hypothetical protein
VSKPSIFFSKKDIKDQKNKCNFANEDLQPWLKRWILYD